MRIVVAGPPKTGNVWIKSLLAEIYGLKVLTDGPTDDARSLQAFIEKGWFEEDSIFHQHYHPTKMLYKLVDSVEARLITTLRNPYDTFVSLFFYVQNFPELFSPENPLFFMLGKPIDHPEVLDYLKRVEKGFGIHLVLANKWIDSDHTIIVKYEKLRTSTFTEAKKITDQIAPVEKDKIRAAILATSAQNMRKKSDILSRHIRKAAVGDWRNHLTEEHLKIIREHHGGKIKKMGYEVA